MHNKCFKKNQYVFKKKKKMCISPHNLQQLLYNLLRPYELIVY